MLAPRTLHGGHVVTSTTSTSIKAIERVEAPPREEFEQDYVKRRRPVILTGVGTKWKAYSDWTPDYLRSVAGKSLVTVHYDENGNFRDWYNNPNDREDRKMPFGDFLDLLLAEPPDLRYYMTEHSLPDVSPELVGDISVSDYIEDVLNPGRASGPNLFAGRDTCMPLHYHPTTEAFMCQLTGTKQVTLYGPEQFPYLYPRPWYAQSYVFSLIDWHTQRAMARRDRSEIDFEKFPKLQQAEGLEFTVHPGEILFIPVHWWHLTTVDSFQLSMTYFWISERARFHYPSPGFQVRAREAMRFSGTTLRNLGRRLTGRPVMDPRKVAVYN
jgi:hypothetical protein